MMNDIVNHIHGLNATMGKAPLSFSAKNVGKSPIDNYDEDWIQISIKSPRANEVFWTGPMSTAVQVITTLHLSHALRSSWSRS